MEVGVRLASTVALGPSVEGSAGGLVYRKCSLAVTQRFTDQGEANGESDLTEGYVRLRFHAERAPSAGGSKWSAEGLQKFTTCDPGLGRDGSRPSSIDRRM